MGREEVTKPGIIATEEQILGSDANRLDAQTHPFHDRKTPPYGTEIPVEIKKTIIRQKQETAAGGIPSLAIAEIAAHERKLASEIPKAAMLRRPSKK